ncbi:MAG: AAA family ATPase [Xanthomonadales bacterium]|nr:AAA family ATPase [Xanthomonadales bacterium]
MSAVLQDEFLDLTEPLDGIGAVELATGEFDELRYGILGTANGEILLLQLGDTLTIQGRYRLQDFDPRLDELCNILVSTRRYSRERDVYITTRRWQGSKPPEPRYWRASLWRSDPGFALQPILEAQLQRNGSWSPVPPPDPPQVQLPTLVYTTPIQSARDNGLQTPFVEPSVELLTVSGNSQAHYGAGQLQWDGTPLAFGPEPPTALALAADGSTLVAASASGQLCLYRKGQSPRSQHLDAGVSVLGCWTHDGWAQLLLASRDGRLRLLREVPPERLRQLWECYVEQLMATPPANGNWGKWVRSVDPPEARELRSLLWLHACFRDPSLRHGLVDFLRIPSRDRPGSRFGEELLYLTNTRPNQVDIVHQLYRAAGLAVREQVDRLGHKAPAALRADCLRNAWEVSVDANDPYTQRAAIGNLATRPFLHEASWPGNAASVAGHSGAKGQQWLLATKSDLLALTAQSGSPISHDLRARPIDSARIIEVDKTRGDDADSEPDATQRTYWLRSLREWPGSVLRGHDRGIELLLARPDGSWTRQDWAADIVTGTPLHGFAGKEAAELWLAWRQGTAVMLDLWQVDGAKRKHRQRAPVRVAATAVELQTVDDQLQLAAATRTRELHWMRLREEAFESVGHTRLDSNVVAMRAALGLRPDRVGGVSDQPQVDQQPVPVLLVGTEGGWLYCLDAAHHSILWAYGAGNSVQALDCIGAGSDLRIGVISTPHWLTMFDAQGRRFWRHHVGKRPSELCLMTDARGALDRIGVIHDGGTFSLYRRCALARYQAQAQQLIGDPQAPPPSDRLRVAAALADRDFSATTAATIKRPEARRLLLAEAARELHVPLAPLLDLPEVRCADIAAMARNLHPERPRSDVKDLWQHAVDLLEEHPTSRQGDMLAELYALARRRTLALADLEDSLDALGQRLGEANVEALFAAAPEAAAQAAHTWWLALPHTDALLARLHRLPVAIAQQLPRFLPEAHAAAPALELLLSAARLHELHRDQTETPSKFGWIAELPTPKTLTRGPDPVLRALRAARDLHPDRWDRVLELLAASRSCPSGGLLPTALRVPASSLRGEPPADSAPLSQQEAWLTRQLGQRWQLPRDTDAGWPRWRAVVEALLAATEAVYRQALTQQLGVVAARCRLRLKARVLRWTGWQARLELELAHDGKFVLDAPQLSLSWHVADPAQGQPLALPYQPTRVAPGDPPWRGVVGLNPPKATRQLNLRLVCCVQGVELDRSDWRVDLGEGYTEPELASSPLLQPPYANLLSRRLAEAKPGVQLLVLDALLQPQAVQRWLAEEAGVLCFALDAALTELGPGRRYPRSLDLNAVFRVLEGRDPLDFEQVYAAGYAPLSGLDGLVLLDLAGFAERLAHPELRGLREAFFRWLRQLAGSRSGPRWLLALPSPLAQRWHAELLDAGTRLLHPAQLQSLDWTDEDWLSLARAQYCGVAEARQRVRAAGWDLRLLCAPDAEARRLHWARAEVTGLRPAELLALVALAEAKVRLRVTEVPLGAMAVERVSTQARKHAAKTLAREGDVLSTPRQLRRLQNVSRDLLVYGLDPAEDLSALTREARVLLQLSGFDARLLNRLARLGLLQQVGDLHLLRPDLALALQQLRAQGLSLRECANCLGDENAWWEGIELAQLAQLQAEDWALWQAGGGASLPLVRASGRLWAGASDAATLASWVSGLSGALHHPITEGYALLAQAGLPKHAGVALAAGPAAQLPPTLQLLQQAWIPVRIGPTVQRQRGLPVIDSEHLRGILRSRRPRQAFWACLRAQLDLQLLSPYVQVGALPPGSPLFVGRRQIRTDVARHLTERSFLILGSRQVGKTSLLHQLWFEAQSRTDALMVLLDAQGRPTPEQLLDPLNRELQRLGVPTATGVDQGLNALVAAASAQRRTPVLMINEVDGLLEQSATFMQQLRARHEHGEMRFIFVGYAPLLWALGDINSPMYHFTTGQYGHFLLGALERAEARELLGWLTKPPLELEWLDEQHQSAGEALMLDAGYDMPWLLQDLCQALVAQLMWRGSGVIELDHVRRMLERRPPLLDKLEALELSKVLGATRTRELGEPGVWWILLCLAQAHYAAEPDWRRLLLQQPPDFSAAEAQATCTSQLQQLPLDAVERARIQAWLQRVQFRELLSALTLTMMLSASNRPEAPTNYCFAQNLYPIELLRAANRGRTLTDRLLERTQQLLTHLQQGTIQ